MYSAKHWKMTGSYKVKLKNENVASMVTLSEQSPYAGNDEDVQYVRNGSIYVRTDVTLVLNAKSSIGTVCTLKIKMKHVPANVL